MPAGGSVRRRCIALLPDGRTLGIFNLPGFVLPEVLGERIDYDLRRLSWIGRLESEDYALLVSGDSELALARRLTRAQ